MSFWIIWSPCSRGMLVYIIGFSMAGIKRLKVWFQMAGSTLNRSLCSRQWLRESIRRNPILQVGQSDFGLTLLLLIFLFKWLLTFQLSLKIGNVQRLSGILLHFTSSLTSTTYQTRLTNKEFLFNSTINPFLYHYWLWWEYVAKPIIKTIICITWWWSPSLRLIHICIVKAGGRVQ